ncbi:hypothetical protein KUH32_12205 [Thalassococcus sp. CAU 1522]|uniref:D-galactarate dehydratase n=1 Tax=Thalassococcus arenae TaxID=2851652 RepID=A0ABS6N950_9RHOB|nr:hypothetical protein [Thalassococcus arenae]MBV2360541.1 hypothetical protein [Thalassococcus arenae]
MKPVIYPVLMFLALSGCADGLFRPATTATPDAAALPDQTRPQARPADATAVAARRPPTGARTAEDFDTTTTAERAEAAAAPQPAGERRLGDTVASLGDVARPGFWLETPLVTKTQKGRIVYAATGQSAQVDLIPIDGPATAGSRISLAAMRLVGAPLTDLPTLEVYAGG